MKCQICTSYISEQNDICERCGYNFKKNKVTDINKVRLYLKELQFDWTKEVQATKKIHEVHKWSIRDTSYLLGISKSNVSSFIQLAKCLETVPQASKFKTKSKAQKFCKQILNMPGSHFDPFFDNEDKLQKFIFNNWENISFFKDWFLKSNSLYGKYNISEVGEIDFLARHRRDNKWLVIELKITKANDQAIGQILRYLGWVKEKLAQNDEVYGIIISEYLDDRIKYALTLTPFIKNKMYYLNNNDVFYLFDPISHDLYDIIRSVVTKDPSLESILIGEFFDQASGKTNF